MSFSEITAATFKCEVSHDPLWGHALREALSDVWRVTVAHVFKFGCLSLSEVASGGPVVPGSSISRLAPGLLHTSNTVF